MTQPDPFIDGYRLIDGTELNNTLANPNWSVAPDFTARAGGTVFNSPLIVNTITQVTQASAPNAGVTLPQALPGRVLLIFNTSPNVITVFAEKGSMIEGGFGGIPGNIGVSQDINLACYYIAIDVDRWFRLDFLPIGFPYQFVETLANITALHAWAALPGTSPAIVSLVSNTTPGDGGGLFYIDPSDTTSVDNGTTIIVDAVGNRWKRELVASQYIQKTPTIAALRSVPLTAGLIIDVAGYYNIGDGGGGQFYAVTGATVGFYVDNGGTIIVPTGGDGSGAWLRVGTNPTTKLFEGDMSVNYFGIFGDGSDCTAALQKAIDAASDVYLPEGNYKITSVITLHPKLNIRGAGGNVTTIRAYDCNGMNVPASDAITKYSFISLVDLSLHSISSATGTYPMLYVGFKTNSVFNPSGQDDYSYDINMSGVIMYGWDKCIWYRGTWYSTLDTIELGYCIYGFYHQGRSVDVDIVSSQIVVDAVAGVAGYTSAIEPDLSAPEGVKIVNTLFASGQYGIYMPIRVVSMNIVNCIIDLVKDKGIFATSSVSLLVSNCWIYAGNYGIYINPQSVVQEVGAAFSNNYITTTNALGNPIFVDYNNKGVTISGGSLFSNAGYCVHSVTSDLSVTGVYLSTTFPYSILFDGADNTAVNNVGNTNYNYAVRSATSKEIRYFGGLAFPTTFVSTADPNTLTAYEVGTWTPVISQDGLGVNTFTTVAAAGSFTRIGNIVTVIGYYTYSSTGTVGNALAILSGLPFIIYNDGNPASSYISIEQQVFDAKTYFVIGSSGYDRLLFQYDNSVGPTYGGAPVTSLMTGVDFPAAATVRISMTYRCAAV